MKTSPRDSSFSRLAVLALIVVLVPPICGLAQSQAAGRTIELNRHDENSVTFDIRDGVIHYVDGDTPARLYFSWIGRAPYGSRCHHIVWTIGVSETKNGKELVDLPKAIREELENAMDPKDPNEPDKENGNKWIVDQGDESKAHGKSKPSYTKAYTIHTNKNWRNQCEGKGNVLTCDIDKIIGPTIATFNRIFSIVDTETRVVPDSQLRPLTATAPTN